MLTTETVERWLAEDVGHRDVTNDVPGDTTGRLVAKEPAVAAGLDAAVAVFDSLGVEAERAVEVGDAVEAGDEVLRVEGDAQSVLRGERVAANVVGHASGVATTTREAVDAAREVSNSVRVAATRKTTPGLRGVEKRAVVAGGGDTHRLTLSGMVMVKDNHVAELGLEEAVNRFAERKSFATKLEVEVETPEMGERAAAAGADIVLFDNLPPEAVREGVSRLPEGVIAEASGGITPETLPAYADTGVDVVSMGWLTHSAPSSDFSFRTG
ncbi:nicotinate-nucleotide diphosphorylase (carboxylating) [Haloferax sp. Atlit-10N]|uniref:Nicotinate-nucleotide pyrophosphorylase [carboxylating] n=1 Tax=Haloferax prahovense (strain DSM 18310 / JCM 13924 / TL6) TaxID=1227461 RepID=M0G662_HALPT|nr:MULTISPECIES: carboxylating nicotinate-nucleotide diphosphorylase [Haloferax]ELZ67002.1 nicotinate-nucleotide pyrophosphorylase [Haloferax prahovense DSM 18310]RDZ44303.1 nicotinate-nucleotide diphosphorylase (carboxylating) [Haloferax sp. Atlit-16N]RDZ58347.1 nicotinate-nucleotide diphosphorylase (carboxylating) [Haloferax sp. Atlit-10N]